MASRLIKMANRQTFVKLPILTNWVLIVSLNIPAALLGVTLVLLTSNVSLGQSIPVSHGQRESRQMSAPVRPAQHLQVVDESIWMVSPAYDAQVVNTLRSTAPSAPHHVILSPHRGPTTDNHASAHASTHPPHLSYHRRVQPPPATLPGANQRETWKTPYSYGYFGASSARHWSKHHGYRDRYKEWRLH